MKRSQAVIFMDMLRYYCNNNQIEVEVELDEYAKNVATIHLVFEYETV